MVALSIVRVGDQDDWKLWTQSAQPPQKVQRVTITARGLEQQEIRSRSCLQSLHRLPSASRGLQMPAIGFTERAKRAEDRRIPAHDEKMHRFYGMGCHGMGCHGLVCSFQMVKRDRKNLDGFDVVSFYADRERPLDCVHGNDNR